MSRAHFDPEKKLVYRIDAEDRIVGVSEEWDRFAAENGASSSLSLSNLLQKPLWDFVLREETRDLLRILLKKVRRVGKPARVPFRCDSPTLHRFLEMEVRPLSGGNIEFITRILREEPRDPVSPLQSRANPSFARLLSVCGWCGHVQVSPGVWVEVEEAIRVLQLFDSMELPRLSHGICPDCRQGLIEDFEKGAGKPAL